MAQPAADVRPSRPAAREPPRRSHRHRGGLGPRGGRRGARGHRPAGGGGGRRPRPRTHPVGDARASPDG
ncbi:hypothetical protein B7486_68715, partial [cyanobacterium TDX16]